ESADREVLWQRALGELTLADDVEPGLLANQYPLSPAQIANAALDAKLRYDADEALSHAVLSNTSSLQLRADLSEFARPRSTRLTLDDLVLPPNEKDAIKEIISACQQRAAVL